MSAEAAMRATLQLAIPLWVERVRGWSPELRQERAAICGQAVAEKGDVLQFGGKKGQAAEVFNRLAEGLAIMSFLPGGVEFLGDRWVTDQSPRMKQPPPPPRAR